MGCDVAGLLQIIFGLDGMENGDSLAQSILGRARGERKLPVINPNPNPDITQAHYEQQDIITEK